MSGHAGLAGSVVPLTAPGQPVRSARCHIVPAPLGREGHLRAGWARSGAPLVTRGLTDPSAKTARHGGVRMVVATYTFFGARCRNHDIPVQCPGRPAVPARDARGGRGAQGLTAWRRPAASTSPCREDQSEYVASTLSRRTGLPGLVRDLDEHPLARRGATSCGPARCPSCRPGRAAGPAGPPGGGRRAAVLLPVPSGPAAAPHRRPGNLICNGTSTISPGWKAKEQRTLCLADVGTRAAAAAFPDDELGGETFGLGRQGRIGYPL